MEACLLEITSREAQISRNEVITYQGELVSLFSVAYLGRNAYGKNAQAWMNVKFLDSLPLPENNAKIRINKAFLRFYQKAGQEAKPFIMIHDYDLLGVGYYDTEKEKQKALREEAKFL